MSEDLVAFLRARLDEDEQIARDAGGRWEPLFDTWVNTTPTGKWEPSGFDHHVAVVVRSYDREHIVRHDPERVLAEVAAKRAMVDVYAEVAELDTEDAEPEFAYGRAAGLGIAVRLIAAAHADHPDYRPKWAPNA